MPIFGNCCSREKDLCRQLEKQTGRVTQLTAALESNQEAQRIVLETKESVLRSLLKQNAMVSQEVSPRFPSCIHLFQRDTLAQRVEDLTTTVEQLTTLLRNVQNRTLSGVLGEETANGAAAIVVKSSLIHGGGHSGNSKAVILGGGGKSKENIASSDLVNQEFPEK